MLVANARMYTVGAATAQAWRALLDWVATTASVPMRYVEHDGPLEALWQRPDLGCAFMCGYPFATWDEARGARPRPLAAPLPRASDGQARYRTCIVVRDDSGVTTIDQLRGRRFAYTTPTSQSGYQAPRRLFAGLTASQGGRCFDRVAGPLVTPRRVVEAVLRDEADAGPLDSYWLDLLSRHEPGTARRLRVVASTPWTPVPLLVCAAAVPGGTRERVTRALLDAGTTAALAETRDTLALNGFAEADAKTYASLADQARETDALGYTILQ
jgi:ABC-type phosphate/phosphonate transport system substrate-binding protein